MANVETLLAALRDRTKEFVTWQKTSSSCPIDAWALVARSAARVLALVGGPTELSPILQQLATTMDCETEAGESPLTGVALTIGALADTLDSRPDVVRKASLMDRSQLRSTILANLHAAAEASVARAAAADEHPVAMHSLRDLADCTAAASHVPLRPLHGAISLLRIVPMPGSLDEAITRWAVTAIDTLSSPTRATKYAFQRTSAAIARICWTGARDLALEDVHSGEVPEVKARLLAAFRSWRVAADWPTELRLDGRSRELRQCSQDLEDALSKRPRRTGPGSLKDFDSVLLTASQVGAVHAKMLKRRAASAGVWISGEALGPSYLTRHPGTHRSEWLPDPGSPYSAGLALASEQANRDLGLAVRNLQRLLGRNATASVPTPAAWERVIRPAYESIERPRPARPSTRSIER